MPKILISRARAEAQSSNGRGRSTPRTHNADRSVAGPTHFNTIKDVANRLGVSPRTVRRWIKTGDLAVHRFGRVVRVAESDLRVFLAVHRDGAL